jgi:hypothetical protein
MYDYDYDYDYGRVDEAFSECSIPSSFLHEYITCCLDFNDRAELVFTFVLLSIDVYDTITGKESCLIWTDAIFGWGHFKTLLTETS